MNDLEWLGLMMGWAVSLLRGSATADDLRRIEDALGEASANGTPLAWDVVRRRLQLTRTEQTTLCLLVAAELSLDIAALVAALTKDPNRPRIDVALLQRVVYADPDTAPRFVWELSAEGALQRFRLVEAGGDTRDNTAFLLRQLRPTRRLIEILHGTLGLDADLRTVARLIASPRSFEGLRLAEGVKERATQLARTLDKPVAREVAPILVLAGPDGGGRRTLLEGIAEELDRACLIVDCTRLPMDAAVLARVCQTVLRETILANALLVLHHVEVIGGDGGRPDRTQIIDDHLVSQLNGLVAATGPGGNTRPATFERGVVVVEVAAPDEANRKVLWERQLGAAGSTEAAAWAAARYTVTGGTIERAARNALAASEARSEPLAHADLHDGVRSALDAKISTIARRIVTKQTWADIVLPEDVLEEVREIIGRVKHREQVYDHWGLGDKIGKGFGISALFSGPPGTGKTMIAGVIAAELGLDLYRVDLSQVVSKYIGETEKNLSGLFDAAEAGHAVLLFDEADSMFAKRTEVKTSNDRYANLEVNFLLQRMETFTGISILTTNLETSIDEAFKRRLSFRIAFPLPEEEERERLWRTMLPPRARIADGLDLTTLAERFDMSGGYIKNAVVRAAFFAADSDEPISEKHLLKAAALEYAAMGKVMHSAR